MKAGPLLKKIIFSSWFLAGVPAILIMLFLPDLSSPYKIDIDPRGKTGGHSIYSDLNSDSIAEFITTGKGIPYYYIVVLDINMNVYDQWNLQDIIDSDLSSYFTGDYDKDGYKEIYVFTHKEDSLFLNINEFFEPSGTKKERIFITKIGYLKGEVTSKTWLAGFYDENSDGNDELYFSITTGFGLFPRRLYSFDIPNNRLNGSQLAGIICQFPKMADADNDDKPEIFGLIGASGNLKEQIPYTDWSTWFMVFNDKLEFEFPPMEFPGYPKVLETNSFKSESINGYVLSEKVTSADTTIPESRMLIYSSDGRLLQSRIYSDVGITKHMRMIVVRSGSYDRIYVLEDKIYEFDENLNVVKTVDLPFTTPYYIYQADINDDGKNEFFLSSPEEEKLIVYNSEFRELAETKFKSPDQAWEFSMCISNKNKPVLYLSSKREGYFFRMIRNQYYYLGFLAYPGTYLGFFLLITLTKKLTTYQVTQIENLKQRLIMLQLQGIKTQLDPHFTFNTLNSIASLIYLEDRHKAYDYMRKFTQLLRSMLNDAEKIYRNLGEEIDFVTTYLELEKLRFGDKFNYKIEIGEGVSKHEQVPKLVLQTFTENALKHGIMPSLTEGLIKISVVQEIDYLRITIEDNGVGRKNSAGQSESTGKGLKLTGEFYEILNRLNKKPIRFTITDLYKDSGDAAGTRVEVCVPLDEFPILIN